MIGCFLMLVAMLGGEQKVAKQEDDILKGVECVRVDIDKLDSHAVSAGLTEEAIQTAMELRLRIADVTVGNPDDESCPVLSFHMISMPAHDTAPHLWAFHFRTWLDELGIVVRNKRALVISTWVGPAGLFTMGRELFVNAALDQARLAADKFANDYLKANPRGEPKKGGGK